MLRKIIEKILFENKLCEMAYERKTLLNEIRNQAWPLYEHILAILTFQLYSDWDQTIQDIVNRLTKILNVKQNRKWIKNKEYLKELLFDEPILDGSEKDTNKAIEFECKALSKEKELVIQHIPNVKELEKIYNKIVEWIWNRKIIDRNDVRDLIKI